MSQAREVCVAQTEVARCPKQGAPLEDSNPQETTLKCPPLGNSVQIEWGSPIVRRGACAVDPNECHYDGNQPKLQIIKGQRRSPLLLRPSFYTANARKSTHLCAKTPGKSARSDFFC